MVTARLALLAVLMLASPAGADDEDAGFNMLSLDSSLGTLRAERLSSVGITVEHPVWRTVRVAAGYDWIWLGDATGHRATLAVRRELFGSGYNGRTFIDGELGGAFAMLSPTPMGGVEVLPTAFVGLRLGWSAYTSRDESPSRMFEAAIAVRVIAVERGGGVTGGVTFAWGN